MLLVSIVFGLVLPRRFRLPFFSNPRGGDADVEDVIVKSVRAPPPLSLSTTTRAMNNNCMVIQAGP